MRNDNQLHLSLLSPLKTIQQISVKQLIVTKQSLIKFIIQILQ
jgi:hypothetical protein